MDSLSREEENFIACPACHSRYLPVKTDFSSGLFATTCQECGTFFKFKMEVTPRANINIIVNNVPYLVDNRFPATMSLNQYLRDILHLTGTKVMCQEGGCGCCVVAATFDDPVSGSLVTRSLNSCLCPLYGCEGWHITTTEGLGGSKSSQGFHPLQERIAEYNGSQCGMCTPGMVMSGYSLFMKSEKPSPKDVEAGFDGNICRCTGYRPILDAMKSFTDKGVADIEEVGRCEKSCQKGSCSGKCKDGQNTSPGPVMLSLKKATWYRPTDVVTLFRILDQWASTKVKLVVGNTEGGGPYDCYIDTKAIKSLYTYQFSENESVMFGANWTLTHLIDRLKVVAQHTGFEYCSDVAAHLQRVANVPVRNVACWAGNLMLKHDRLSFASDISVMLESLSARITVGSTTGTEHYTVEQFLSADMTKKVILSVTLPPLTPTDFFKSYKVMPRSQNSLAYVNAAFRMSLDKTDKYRVLGNPALVYGNISSMFTRAKTTEAFLTGKQLADPDVLKAALRMLDSEINPALDLTQGSATYRQKLAISLFYKFVLFVLGDALPADLRSGGHDLERPLSSGTQKYDTHKDEWPLTEPMPKTASKLQASGEAQYINDIPSPPGELFAAFVVSSVGSATIASLDPSEALAVPGVVKFLMCKDIPGVNNIVPQGRPEELFCSGTVVYAGQSLGLVIAETQAIADSVANLVHVTYKDVKQPLLDIKEAIKQKSFFPKPGDDVIVGHPEEAISKSAHKIEGEVYAGTQYHFTLETQSCLCIPTQDRLEVYPSTQWIDTTQAAISQVLNMQENKVHLQVERLGGAYGAKCTRNWPISAACALGAYVMNRPVRMRMDLATNMSMIGKRFSYLAEYKIGVTDEGQLNGIKVTYNADCGISDLDSSLAAFHMICDSGYQCPNWHIIRQAVKTNKPAPTFCRAPGTTPAILVIETMLEHVAKVLNKDPIGIKTLNLYTKNQVTPGGEVLDQCNVRDLVASVKQSANVDQRQSLIQSFNKANRWKKRGLGMVPIRFPAGYAGNPFNVLVAIYGGDGSISITHGGIEMGQGINTKVMQVCAYELGIPLKLVTVRPSDAHSNANSSVTAGSVGSELCCKGVIKCCEALKARMTPVKAKMKTPSWLELVQKCLQEGVDISARYWVSPKTATTYNTYGVTVSEVELDVLTGESIILRTDILNDCGKSMNPDIDIGQVEGAHVMGLGYFLSEEIEYDPATGKNLNTSTWTYKPPTSKDIPADFRIELWKNSPNTRGVLGSKIVAEPPLCMSSATFFALKHAIDAARMDAGKKDYFPLDVPATVEKAQLHCDLDISQFVIAD